MGANRQGQVSGENVAANSEAKWRIMEAGMNSTIMIDALIIKQLNEQQHLQTT